MFSMVNYGGLLFSSGVMVHGNCFRGLFGIWSDSGLGLSLTKFMIDFIGVGRLRRDTRVILELS